MELIALFVLGLAAIGYVTSAIAKVVDKNVAKGVAAWGCVVASLWILYVGGMIVCRLVENS